MQRVSSAAPSLIADAKLFGSALLLLSLGWIMVASASSPVALSEHHQQLYFFYRQGIFMLIGLVLAAAVTRVDLQHVEKFSRYLLIINFIFLALVLIPGIGRVLNGSRRWLNLGLFGFQVSEFVKLSFVIYLAGYLTRNLTQMSVSWSYFLKPLLVLGLILGLLLCEPDFGAGVMLVGVAMGMLFLARVPWMKYMVVLSIAAVLMFAVAILAPYRWLRVTSFLDPWAHPFSSGYQLIQSLIAFGRGGWFGVGLGDSLQKQFYLPEPQTDFIFAVIAEEFGLIGVLVVIGLFAMLFIRGLYQARLAYQQKKIFNAFLAYGISLYFILQMVIHVGVSTGLLPTKGLTLPLMSYGGSSLCINMIALALLLRVAYENQAPRKPRYG